MRLLPALLGVAIFLGASAANASLSSSERGQIRDFVATAKAENAHKVRSLVARTDLAPEESVAALTEAITPVGFTEQRGVFLRELLFGGASAASRPVLVPATVRALLARADGIYQRYVGGLDHEPRAVQELVAIYGFIDAAIANAGKPTSLQHDANAGIARATYEDCSKVLGDHIDKNARWLKGEGVIPETVAPARAQAQVAFIDMLPDGLTRWVDAANRLALTGARRGILQDSGALFADAGAIDDTKVQYVRQLLSHFPGARADLGLVYVGDARLGPLRCRGSVAYVTSGAERYPFDEVEPGTYDATTSAIAHELSVLAAKRALASRDVFRVQVERDVAATSGDAGRLLGHPHAPSVAHVLGAAIHAVMIDAPKATDFSTARLLGGRPETAALLSDALGALAQYPSDVRQVNVAKGPAWTTATEVRTDPNGTVVSFTLDRHTWSIDRPSPSNQVVGARRDGAVISTGQLASAKSLPHDGAQWAESGYTFSRLRGTPRLGLSAAAADKAGGPNVRLLGGSADSWDVVTVVPPSVDFIVEGELVVRDGPGGIGLRVAATKTGFRGATLVVTPGGTTVLSVVDESGGETHLASPVSSPTGPIHLKISVQGTNVLAVVGNATLRGTLPSALGVGHVAIIAKRNGNVEVGSFTVKRR